jgi:hypothetical protein
MEQITKVFHTNCKRATNEKKFSMLFDNDMILWCLATSDLAANGLDLPVEEISRNS